MRRRVNLSDIFIDDSTGQLSLGRLSSALILACMLITTRAITDIPANWLTAMLAFYGVNKLSSTVKEIKNVAEPVVAE